LFHVMCYVLRVFVGVLLTKLIFPLALILGALGGPNYVQLDATDLVFDFETGGSRPIYHFLNVQNIGPQSARFEISTDKPEWIFTYREGLPVAKSVTIGQGSGVNFTLEIHPEVVDDGSHRAIVVVKAYKIDANVSTLFDTKTVDMTFNKNFVPTPIPTATPEPSISPFASVSETPEPVIEPTESSEPLPTAMIDTTKPTPTPIITKPTPTPLGTPIKFVPAETPVKLDTVVTATPEISIQPVQKEDTPRRSFFKVILDFFRGWF